MAYRHEFDAQRALLVCRFVAPVDANCYSEHLDVLDAAVTACAPSELRLAVLVIFEGRVSPPDAKTRQRAAQVSSREEFNLYIAMVTTNPLFRGVLTALSWIRRQRHEHHMVPDVESGIDWLVAKRGGERAQLLEMLQRTDEAEPRVG